MGLIQGVVLQIKRYLGHNTRELGDTAGVQDKKRDESRLLSRTLDEVAGCGLGAGRRGCLEEGGSGAGLAGVMVCSVGRFQDGHGTSEWAKASGCL